MNNELSQERQFVSSPEGLAPIAPRAGSVAVEASLDHFNQLTGDDQLPFGD